MLPQNIGTLFEQVVLHKTREHTRDRNKQFTQFKLNMFKQGLIQSSAFINGKADIYCEAFEKYAEAVWVEMQKVLNFVGFKYYQGCEDDLIKFLKDSLTHCYDLDRNSLFDNKQAGYTSYEAYNSGKFNNCRENITDKLTTEITLFVTKLKSAKEKEPVHVIINLPKERIDKKTQWSVQTWCAVIAVALTGIGLIGGAIWKVYTWSKSIPGSQSNNSQPHTLSQSANNSPGAIQAGRDVIIQRNDIGQQPIVTNTGGWQPPELPPGCSNIFIFFGGSQMSFPRWALEFPPAEEWKPEKPSKKMSTEEINQWPPTTNNKSMWMGMGMHYSFAEKSVVVPIYPYVKNNRVFLYVEAPFQNEKHKFIIGDDLDSQLPALWDRNYTSNAFEVVREDGLPVLQVIYKRANDVQVKGIFIVDNYDAVAAFDADPVLIILSAVVSDDQSTQKMRIEDFSKMFTNSNLKVDTSAIYGMKFSGQKAIFKYPSWKYRSVLAN